MATFHALSTGGAGAVGGPGHDGDGFIYLALQDGRGITGTRFNVWELAERVAARGCRAGRNEQKEGFVAITGIKHRIRRPPEKYRWERSSNSRRRSVGRGCRGAAIGGSQPALLLAWSAMSECQLIQGLDPNGRYASHVARHGRSINHICYTVDNLRAAVDQALAEGATCASRPTASRTTRRRSRWKATVGRSQCVSELRHRRAIQRAPEKWVYFLRERSGVGGTVVELMQELAAPGEIPRNTARATRSVTDMKGWYAPDERSEN